MANKSPKSSFSSNFSNRHCTARLYPSDNSPQKNAFSAGWHTITQAWTSGASVTNANLCLRVMSGEGVGNDFGLDDITMQGTIRLRDHKEVTVTPLPAFDLGPNATLCNGQNLVLDAVPGGTYVWQDGSTLPDYVVSGPGIYSVTVTANGCSAVDGIIVNYNALPVVNLGPDLSLCDGDTSLLSAATPGGSYIWQDGSTASTFNVTGPGTYSVQVTVNNCSASDAVDIAYNPYPVVDLGVDIAACDGDIVTLDATTPSATYQWSDGSGMAVGRVMRRSCLRHVLAPIRASPDGALSGHSNHTVIPQLLPGQPQYQSVELGQGERQRAAPLSPTEAPLVEPPAGEPDSLAVVDQHLQPRAALVAAVWALT